MNMCRQNNLYIIFICHLDQAYISSIIKYEWQVYTIYSYKKRARKIIWIETSCMWTPKDFGLFSQPLVHVKIPYTWFIIVFKDYGFKIGWTPMILSRVASILNGCNQILYETPTNILVLEAYKSIGLILIHLTWFFLRIY